jgi:hypothetical protein
MLIECAYERNVFEDEWSDSSQRNLVETEFFLPYFKLEAVLGERFSLRQGCGNTGSWLVIRAFG